MQAAPARTEQAQTVRRLSHVYFLLSAVGAALAIGLTAQQQQQQQQQQLPQATADTEVRKSMFFPSQAPAVAAPPALSPAALQDGVIQADGTVAIPTSRSSSKHAAFLDDDNEDDDSDNPHKLPAWLRWIVVPASPEEDDESKEPETVPPAAVAVTPNNRPYLFLDPALLQPSATTFTDLIDKVLTSTPRLVAIVNLLLALTFLLHAAVADWFLGNANGGGAHGNRSVDWAAAAGRDRLGGFLVFKLLLISAVMGPDPLDLLILLSWYTLLSFLRSLAHLCAGTTQHTSHSGQPPRSGVLQLLLFVLLSDFLAAAVCVALLHAAGWSMVVLLTCDCALLAVDVLGHIFQHGVQKLEQQHADALSRLNARQLELHRQMQQQAQQQLHNSDEDSDNEDDDEALEEVSRELDRLMEKMERNHAGNLSVLDTSVFSLQLVAHILTVCHFVHIWSLHGVQFTLIDGVLALHLHSALSSASKKIAERRNLHRIAREMDCSFLDATDMDLKKASAAGDLCSICYCTMSSGPVKKIGCGHLYHTSCLRGVVERAPSMEAATCPLCRASVLDGRPPNHFHARPAVRDESGGPETNGPNNNRGDTDGARINNNAAGGGGERALFRFSTEGIFPAWLPVPAFSFEVVRRPVLPPAGGETNRNEGDPQQQQTSLIRQVLEYLGIVPMTPQQETAAINQLSETFPQYDRAYLLRELRMHGSAQRVAEVLLNRGSVGGVGGADGGPMEGAAAWGEAVPVETAAR